MSDSHSFAIKTGERRSVKRSRGVTLSDIAARVGVSKVTVSYVLNEKRSHIRISDETRRRVQEVANELGYYPNALARGLTRQQMDTFTLVMQSPSVFRGGSGFINAMMLGVVEAANAIDYDVMLHTKTLPDVATEVRSLTDGRADGSLVLRDGDDPLLPALMERGHPCVSIFSRPEVPSAWYVDCDNVLGGQQATEYLLSLGHRRIGYIGGSPHSSSVQERRQGYQKALQTAGIASVPEWDIQINFAGANFAPLLELMEQPAAQRPTAFFAWSDDVAAQTIRLLRDRWRVPNDVSIIGFDGTEAVGEQGCFPRLTSIRQPIQEIAAHGVALLVAQIREEVVSSSQVLFAPSLVIRDSCAVLPNP
jgi:LacI family transcriptional regulator